MKDPNQWQPQFDKIFLERHFHVRPYNPEFAARYEAVNQLFNEFLNKLVATVPDSTEMSRVVHRLDEAHLLAHAAISRNDF